MSSKALIAGVGMIKFSKPGRGDPYDAMAAEATRLALADAALDYTAVQQAYVGFALGDTTSAQQVLYKVGLSGIPIINVNNACASGSTALYLARQAVASGAVDVALALGFEQMGAGALGGAVSDRPAVNGMVDALVERTVGWDRSKPQAAHYFGGAAREYLQRTGTKAETLGKVSVKARAHAAHNPFALFTVPLSLEEVMTSPMVFDPLTRLQCCPPTCGAAAAIVVSEAYARRQGLIQPVRILGQAMTSDVPGSFEHDSMIEGVGFELAQRAAASVYAEAGVGPKDIDVVELHDCFSIAEALAYESLGFCPVGGAEKFIEDGSNTYGGSVVTNPSGGLLSKGHPLGATGLAQCAELIWHLRGTAGARQVQGAKTALQHNIGLGSACVVTLYQI